MKRALVFVLLLALGFLLLYRAIGDDGAVAAGSGGAPDGPTGPERSRPGVGLNQGGFGTAFEQRGHFVYPRTRPVPLPGGGVRHERTFVLEAKDSQPVRDGLQQLDGVEITLFDADRPAALVTARQAFVELGRDASGRVSLREDKAIDLREVVLATLRDSRLAGLRLELGNAIVHVGEDEVQVRTANETDPVLLVLDGERRGTLRGKGLQARLPRDRGGALQRADVDILHEPVLETEGLVVRGRGRLHYAEDTATGTAAIDIEHVDVEFAGGSFALAGAGAAGRPPGPTRARGDQLAGWLLRGKEPDASGAARDRLVWRLLQLRGAPVDVQAPGLQVATPRLSVVPGRSGEPFVVTASGGASEVVLERTGKPGEPPPAPLVGRSPRRIHLVAPGEQAGEAHRLFGFPRWTLRQLSDLHAVAFEGHATIADGVRDVDAADGIHVFRSDPHGDPQREGVLANAAGEVRIDQRGRQPGEVGLHARGNDGFRLTSTPAADRLELGPVRPDAPGADDRRWRAHRYLLRHGASTATGAGDCRIETESALDRTTVTLRAPGDEIEAVLPADGLRLTGVRALSATFDAAAIRELRVAGLPATATFVRRGETLVARAPRLEQLGPASVSLLGIGAGDEPEPWSGLAAEHALPHLQRRRPATTRDGAQTVDARGPRIDVHHFGGDHAAIDVQSAGDQLARIDAVLGRLDGKPATTIALAAARLRLFPFAIPPAALHAHTGGAGGLAALLPFRLLREPWLHGERVQRVVADDADHGRLEGSAHELLLSAGAASGLFAGDPDTLAPATVTQTEGGRTITARGARVRMFREEGLRLQALRAFPGRSTAVLPSVEVHEPGSTNLLAHLFASCQGDIDVLPERVDFLGPVVANGVTAAGAPDPDGLHLDAAQLTMERRAESGEIVRVLARDVNVGSTRFSAHSAALELDPLWNRITARDPAGARVQFPDGRTVIAERSTLDYATLAIDWYRGRVEQARPPEALFR